jgi:hypothetical protein
MTEKFTPAPSPDLLPERDEMENNGALDPDEVRQAEEDEEDERD